MIFSRLINDVVHQATRSTRCSCRYDIIDEARKIIRKQFPDGVPTVMDPFCGGGLTLIETQRLGTPRYARTLTLFRC